MKKQKPTLLNTFFLTTLSWLLFNIFIDIEWDKLNLVKIVSGNSTWDEVKKFIRSSLIFMVTIFISLRSLYYLSARYNSRKGKAK